MLVGFLQHSINKASGDKARALESSKKSSWLAVSNPRYLRRLAFKRSFSKALLVCNE